MDWKAIIAALRAAGITQMQMAAAAGCAQTTISDLSHGRIKHPRYDIGVALIGLHARVSGGSLADPVADAKGCVHE